MWLKQISGIARAVSCALAALILGLAATPALAAKVYRCGNVFQDQPCATDKEKDANAATKAATARDASTPTLATRPASGTTSTTREPDRLVLDAPRSVAIEVRR